MDAKKSEGEGPTGSCWEDEAEAAVLEEEYEGEGENNIGAGLGHMPA